MFLPLAKVPPAHRFVADAFVTAALPFMHQRSVGLLGSEHENLATPSCYVKAIIARRPAVIDNFLTLEKFVKKH